MAENNLSQKHLDKLVKSQYKTPFHDTFASFDQFCAKKMALYKKSAKHGETNYQQELNLKLIVGSAYNHETKENGKGFFGWFSANVLTKHVVVGMEPVEFSRDPIKTYDWIAKYSNDGKLLNGDDAMAQFAESKEDLTVGLAPNGDTMKSIAGVAQKEISFEDFLAGNFSKDDQGWVQLRNNFLSL